MDPYLEIFQQIQKVDPFERTSVRHEEYIIQLIEKAIQWNRFSVSCEPHRARSSDEGHNIVTLSCQHLRFTLIQWLVERFGKRILLLAASSHKTPLHTFLYSVSFTSWNSDSPLLLYRYLVKQQPLLLNALYEPQTLTMMRYQSPLYYFLTFAVTNSLKMKREPHLRRYVHLFREMIQDGALLYPYPFSKTSEIAKDFFLTQSKGRSILSVVTPLVSDLVNLCCKYIEDPIFEILAIPTSDQLDLLQDEHRFNPEGCNVERLNFIRLCLVAD
jgi:hypothetical protein